MFPHQPDEEPRSLTCPASPRTGRLSCVTLRCVKGTVGVGMREEE